MTTQHCRANQGKRPQDSHSHEGEWNLGHPFPPVFYTSIFYTSLFVFTWLTLCRLNVLSLTPVYSNPFLLWKVVSYNFTISEKGDEILLALENFFTYPPLSLLKTKTLSKLSFYIVTFQIFSPTWVRVVTIYLHKRIPQRIFVPLKLTFNYIRISIQKYR